MNIAKVGSLLLISCIFYLEKKRPCLSALMTVSCTPLIQQDPCFLHCLKIAVKRICFWCIVVDSDVFSRLK